ncbi:hypothetical protein [Halalkalibacter krulwichiae]|uniref:Uncharacterized protein n=1 Tax=Halalkalibacter krulwichiae TaxID=199441 RepID=A0A1X9MNE3_9BACI|nr:hypothetical protein [Halalkalibacter krulwichiae]ARK32852.1 hypothetical protein BkAM31D_24965 [Halalkalibacter krulwichiae]
MVKKGTNEIQRGQAITFRLPSDTPDHILKQLQKLKETERRNFSSKIAQFALEGVSNSLAKERETVTIPIPRQLSKEQRSWLKHSHSEALLGNIIYQLLCDPVRATSVLASLNSQSLDIEEALYLQEHQPIMENEESNEEDHSLLEEVTPSEGEKSDDFEDDLMNFDWGTASEEIAASREEPKEEEEESGEDLLGDFLAQLNK